MSQHKLDKAIAREFGERIRTARRSLGLGQHHLAAPLGLTRAAVASWETGRSLPSAQHLQQLSATLKIDILGVGKAVTLEPPQSSMGLADALSRFVRENGERGGRQDALLPDHQQPDLVADAMRLLDKLRGRP